VVVDVEEAEVAAAHDEEEEEEEPRRCVSPRASNTRPSRHHISLIDTPTAPAALPPWDLLFSRTLE